MPLVWQSKDFSAPIASSADSMVYPAVRPECIWFLSENGCKLVNIHRRLARIWKRYLAEIACSFLVSIKGIVGVTDAEGKYHEAES